MPSRATGTGRRARRAAHRVIERFGYLQLDTVAVAGARSHAIVLASRLAGFDCDLAEALLQPGEPLFEYWGHEASWLPLDLYPVLDFRRREFRTHPWWGDLIGAHPRVADRLMRRIRDEGPLRSADMEGSGGRGWWDLKLAKKVASALWSSGELAIRERRGFQRVYDLAERVIPEPLRNAPVAEEDALERLLLLALDGHGWATSGTLAATWRLRNRRDGVGAALRRLRDRGDVLPCRLQRGRGRSTAGWIRPADLDLAGRLEGIRPRRDRGVLLSPFDPVAWDRGRVEMLFGFHQVLEIFKPASKRTYGYYCLPVLAGDHLIGRVDLRAVRRSGRIEVLSMRFEDTGDASPGTAAAGAAAVDALRRYGDAVGLTIAPDWSGRAP